ncbi:MAG: hypothetical protein V1875_01410 [Candidatus Altiarchaeota archaeon]
MVSGIRVCLRCGSSDIQNLYGGVGIAVGTPPSNVHCNDCGWVGLPLIMDDEAARERFVQEIGKEPGRREKVGSQQLWGEYTFNGKANGVVLVFIAAFVSIQLIDRLLPFAVKVLFSLFISLLWLAIGIGHGDKTSQS